MKRLSRNALSILLSDIGRRLIGFVAVAFLARKVGTEGFGMINIGFTVLAYAILAGSGGLVSYGTREVARGKTDNLVNRIISLRLFLTIPIFGTVILLSWIVVRDPVMLKVITVFCLSMFAYAVLLDWFFQGREEMVVPGIGRGVSAILYLLCILLFVRTADDIIWVAIGALIGDSVSAVVMLISYKRKFGDMRLRFEPKEWKAIAKESFPLGIGNVMGSVTVNLAPLVIGIVLSNADAGIFSAAGKLVFFLLIFDRVFAQLLLPAATRFHTDSMEVLSAKLSVAAKWVILLALPVSLGGSLLAPKIIPLVFGSQYTEAIIVFRVLIWYFFFTVLHTIFTSGLVAIGQEKLYSKVMMISAVIYLLSTVILTYTFGVVGTACAMAGSEAITLILMKLEFEKFVKLPLTRYVTGAVPSALIMGYILFVLPSLQVFLAIGVGAVVYCAMLFLTKAITIKDTQELLERI